VEGGEPMITLLPIEQLALRIARAMLEEDPPRNPPINTTGVLVMTIDRLTNEEN
jgi:hypothetical protein